MPNDGNTGLNVSFSPGLQTGLINSRGLQMIHEFGLSCPCRAEDPHSSLLNDGKDNRRDVFCVRCGQDGWLFRDPVLLTGMITNIRHQRNILDAATTVPGDATFSPSTNSPTCKKRKIGTNDKLTATWPEPIDDGQIIRRGAGYTLATQGIVTELSENEDRLWYEPADAIWCEDEFGTIYDQNGDFVLGPGRIIKWIGNRPILNARYTIKYEAFFEWIVFQPPGERRDRDGANLGEIVFLRKRHIEIINTSPFAINEDKQSLQSSIKI